MAGVSECMVLNGMKRGFSVWLGYMDVQKLCKLLGLMTSAFQAKVGTMTVGFQESKLATDGFAVFK
jgi:hypothetical protein